MKKILILISIIAFAASCTLEEKVISSSTPDTYYQTVVQCKTGLNGCYIPLRSLYQNADYFEVCEVASDLIFHSNTTSYYDAFGGYTPTMPRFATGMWRQGYVGVMRCNAVYAAIERSPLTEEEKAPLLAECVILRAFYYYILTINFGDVPYYFEEVTDENNNKIAQLPRMPAEELRNILMDELEYWLIEKQALPYIKTYDPSNEYRIGAMVGFTIAGKLAMWNKAWARAIKFYSYIEGVYGYVDEDAMVDSGSSDSSDDEDDSGSSDNSSSIAGYVPKNALLGYPITDIMFRNRYTAESIFELPAYAKDYGFRVTHGLASRCTPTRSSTIDEGVDGDLSEEFDETIDLSKKDDMYNGIRIPELGADSRTTSPYRPTTYFYTELMPAKSTDKRRSTYDAGKFSNDGDINVVEGGGGYLAWCYAGWTETENVDIVPRHMVWFASVKNADGRPFLGDKFWCPGMVYTQDSNNIKIFRFAHVVLDLAEAHMRMGNWELANDYLNAPKRRAGIQEVSRTDEEGFMNELMAESGRELFGEFTRRHNLVRWDVWSERVAQYNNNSLMKTNAAAYPCLEYYPIPDKEVVLSNYALDNKEYEKYGL